MHWMMAICNSHNKYHKTNGLLMDNRQAAMKAYNQKPAKTQKITNFERKL